MKSKPNCSWPRESENGDQKLIKLPKWEQQEVKWKQTKSNDVPRFRRCINIIFFTSRISALHQIKFMTYIFMFTGCIVFACCWWERIFFAIPHSIPSLICPLNFMLNLFSAWIVHYCTSIKLDNHKWQQQQQQQQRKNDVKMKMEYEEKTKAHRTNRRWLVQFVSASVCVLCSEKERDRARGLNNIYNKRPTTTSSIHHRAQFLYIFLYAIIMLIERNVNIWNMNCETEIVHRVLLLLLAMLLFIWFWYFCPVCTSAYWDSSHSLSLNNTRIIWLYVTCASCFAAQYEFLFHERIILLSGETSSAQNKHILWFWWVGNWLIKMNISTMKYCWQPTHAK